MSGASWRNRAIILRAQLWWFHPLISGLQEDIGGRLTGIAAQADDLFLGAPEQREIEPSEQLDHS